MVAVTLHLYRRDRSQLIVAAIALAMLLIALGLLASGVILAAGTADSSPVDVRFVAPFRWGQGIPPNHA